MQVIVYWRVSTEDGSQRGSENPAARAAVERWLSQRESKVEHTGVEPAIQAPAGQEQDRSGTPTERREVG